MCQYFKTKSQNITWVWREWDNCFFNTKLISSQNHQRTIDVNPYWFQVDTKLFLFFTVPLPCIVSEWTKWSAPDATGTRYRVRYMLRPALNGGKECSDLIQLGKGKNKNIKVEYIYTIHNAQWNLSTTKLHGISFCVRFVLVKLTNISYIGLQLWCLTPLLTIF